MTEQEFDNTEWSAGMEFRYKGKGEKLPVCAVDFEERLIAYPCDNAQEMSWVRCENAVLVDNSI